MIVRTSEAAHQAILLRVLAEGEQLAHDCALGQARMATTPGMRRFFLAQARQEAFHRRVFQSAALWLAPRGVGRNRGNNRQIRDLRRLIEDALRRNDLAETLLGQQVVLEGLGEAVLAQVDIGMDSRGMRFQGIRRTLLRQEHAHYVFGIRQLERLVFAGVDSCSRLRERARPYLALSEDLLAAHESHFDFFDEDPRAYARDARRNLPAWLT